MYISFKTGQQVKVNEKHYDFNLDLAHRVSSQSKDADTKVGCVVTDEDFVLISSGYNGPNRQADDEHFNFTRKEVPLTLFGNYEHLGLKDEKRILAKHPFMIHAEINALVNCTNRKSFKDSIVFVTHYCCTTCFNTLIQSKVKRIVMDDNKHSAFDSMLPEILFLMENSKLPEDFVLIRKNLQI